MGILDSALRSVTQNVLVTFGTSATIRRQARVFTPATATSTVTNTDHAVKCRPERYRAFEIDGDVVRHGDLKVLIAAKGLAITPTPAKDKLILGGVSHEIRDVARIYATEQVAAYEVQARS